MWFEQMNKPTTYPFPPARQAQNCHTFIMIDSFLSKDECRKLVKLMKHGDTQRAKVEADGSGKEVPKTRGTTILGVEPSPANEWIFRKLHACIDQVNREAYGFELQGFFEGIQISQYDVDDHYDWHIDIGGGVLSQRKLSIVIQLSDPDDYAGGELEFFAGGPASIRQGTLILFPSYLMHRVKPITEGTRHSLVAWISGDPYK